MKQLARQALSTAWMTQQRPSLCHIAVGFVMASAIHTAALANQQLATAKSCMACHNVAKKVVGPSFKEVAAKYTGQPGATDALAQKIRMGSRGVWGAVPMPANPQVSPADAKALAVWVLSTPQ
jgi:cytochrome c